MATSLLAKLDNFLIAELRLVRIMAMLNRNDNARGAVEVG